MVAMATAEGGVKGRLLLVGRGLRRMLANLLTTPAAFRALVGRCCRSARSRKAARSGRRSDGSRRSTTRRARCCRPGSLRVCAVGSPGPAAPLRDGHVERCVTISLRQLSNPLLVQLLHATAQEYGYSHSGALRVACSADALQAALRSTFRVSPELDTSAPLLHLERAYS